MLWMIEKNRNDGWKRIEWLKVYDDLTKTKCNSSHISLRFCIGNTK